MRGRAKRPVLVVDNSLTTRMLEQSILESAGYDVDVADLGGGGARNRLRHKRYALILVDVEMPGMDGFTFIERIRSDPALHDIPAILVTSRASPEDLQRGRDVGAHGHIVKSEFDQAELLAMIKPMMGRDRWRRLRVLVAEDSAHRAQAAGRDRSPPIRSSSWSARPRTASSAIEMCALHRPDVITMDMMMPVMSGLAATEYIMAHCPTPILIVSASINRGELFKIYEALAAGAVDVLEKPTGDEPDGDWERRFLAAVKLVARIRVITHPRGRLARPADARRVDVTVAVPRGRARAKSTSSPSARRRAGPARSSRSCAACPAPSDSRSSRRCTSMSRSARPLRTGSTGRLDAAAWPIREDGDAGRLGQRAASWLRRAASISSCATGACSYTADPERHSCRPSVDVLFESVAADTARPPPPAC